MAQDRAHVHCDAKRNRIEIVMGASAIADREIKGLRRRNTQASAKSVVRRQARTRSEEHTSELQSHSDLVCRLLLEKKKKKTQRDSNSGRTWRRLSRRVRAPTLSRVGTGKVPSATRAGSTVTNRYPGTRRRRCLPRR